MDDALIVEDQRRPRLSKREALACTASGGKDAGLTAADALALDENDDDEVDAISVGAFGRGAADALVRVDAKLMRLDEPGLAALLRRTHGGETAQQLQKRRCGADVVADGFEPALEPAVQGVVVDALPVGPVGHSRDMVAVDDEAGVPSRAIVAAVFEPAVSRQVGP